MSTAPSIELVTQTSEITLPTPAGSFELALGRLGVATMATEATREKNAYQTGIELGLYEEPPTVSDGLRANLIAVSRVVGFGGPKGIQEAELIKVKTLVDVKELGEVFEEILREEGFCAKDIGSRRVFRDGLRRLSIDELGNLVNIFGIGKKYFDKPLKMKMVGAGRNLMAQELAYGDDNTNDYLGRALDMKVRQHNFDSRDEAYSVYGRLFSGDEYFYGNSDGTETSNGSAVSLATSKGTRQIRNEYDIFDWLTGVEYYDYIQSLPAPQRQACKLRLLGKTAGQVLLQTDAA